MSRVISQKWQAKSENPRVEIPEWHAKSQSRMPKVVCQDKSDISRTTCQEHIVVPIVVFGVIVINDKIFFFENIRKF